MEKSPNKEVLNTLNSIKEKLEELYGKYKTMYDNAKDDKTVKIAIDGANTIISEHKIVVSDLKKYHALFTALYTPEYNGNQDIINQINNFEKEIIEKYKDKMPAPNNATPTPALEKGKKYSVTETKKSENGNDKFLGIISSVGSLALLITGIKILTNIDVSTVFDTLISIPLYGSLAAACGWGVIATGKFAYQKLKEANEKSKSK